MIGIRPAGFVSNSLGELFETLQLLNVIRTKAFLRFVDLDQSGSEFSRLFRAGHILVILFLFQL